MADVLPGEAGALHRLRHHLAGQFGGRDILQASAKIGDRGPHAAQYNHFTLAHV